MRNKIVIVILSILFLFNIIWYRKWFSIAWNTIKPLIISKSDVNNGETVYSMGNTLNQGITISKGIVSNSSVSYNSLNYICIDNIIDYGNSSGTLMNSSMELIGITTFKIEITKINENKTKNLKPGFLRRSVFK